MIHLYTSFCNTYTLYTLTSIQSGRAINCQINARKLRRIDISMLSQSIRRRWWWWFCIRLYLSRAKARGLSYIYRKYIYKSDGQLNKRARERDATRTCLHLSSAFYISVWCAKRVAYTRTTTTTTTTHTANIISAQEDARYALISSR